MNTQPIPFLDLVTPNRELEDELVAAFRDAVRSAQFIGGPEVDKFEREFADYCGAKYCVGVASGTDALRFALMAAGVGPGDSVVTVAHTFIATVEAISQAGSATDFVDIDPVTYAMSPSSLTAYLDGCRKDSRTGRPVGWRSGKPIKAIVPVHLYGQVADMDGLLEVAARFGLLLVEDACQAHGAEYKTGGAWRRAGTFGRAAAFSFYPGKNLGACGEAGALTTDDEGVARTARMLRDHGQSQKYYHELEGYNGRLDAIQAAFLRIKLRRLDEGNAQRRAIAKRYDERLSSVPGIVVPSEPASAKSVYHLYVVRSANRDALAEGLKANGIHTGLHYPLPVHLQNCYRHWGYRIGDLPATEKAAAEILSLPMFPGLDADAQERVCGAIEAFAAAASKR